MNDEGVFSMQQYDKIVIGAGFYGMYAADYCAKRGEHVLVLEYDSEPFKRASYINQARVHMGYHYPRSLSTATKSAGYFRRFSEEFDFCIHSQFEQIYATSSKFSWTNAEQFQKFCQAANIMCHEVAPSEYFKDKMCDGAFLTEEYTYDAFLLRDYYWDRLKQSNLVTMEFQAKIQSIEKKDKLFTIILEDGRQFETPYVLNVSYASVNQIINKVIGVEKNQFDIKYELCEIILCKPSEQISKIGFTVMDGPFFSIMPFGKTGLHSLTSVTFTPHVTCYKEKPEFSCQEGTDCSPQSLANCSECRNRPSSAWPYMSHLADKYLKSQYAYTYEKSLFSMKPILKSSEVDDSRPTCIKILSEEPTFISVLSGKINTVYDLEEYL